MEVVQIEVENVAAVDEHIVPYEIVFKGDDGGQWFLRVLSRIVGVVKKVWCGRHD